MMSVRPINNAGLNLIKSFEGIADGNPKTVNLDPYADPIGILTIGWGHALTFGERFLRNNSQDWAIAKQLYPVGISMAEAEGLLRHDIEEHSRDLATLVKVPINDNQYAALASLSFNIGVNNFKSSSVLRFVNAGDFKRAADAFLRWNKAGGKVLQGLIRRREAERALFLS
jgi:lysozyme